MAFVAQWNVAASKFFESGVDRGVLYLRNADGSYADGVAWEGLISVSEKPAGAEPTDLFANNTKYATLVSTETFEGTIEAYAHPVEFWEAQGVLDPEAGMFAHQQARRQFGLTYRTYIGTEAAGQTGAYRLHVIYGCLAKPSEVSRQTINDSPEAATFSWDFSSTPAAMAGFEPVSKLTFDSATLTANGLAALENSLYGNTTGPVAPKLELPDAIRALAATV